MSEVFVPEGRRLIVRLIGVLGPRLLSAACLLLAASVALPAARNLWFAFRATAVHGVVVRQDEEWTADWRERQDGRPGDPQLSAAQRVYQAVVQFTADGRTYEVRAMRRAPVHVYPLGSRLAVVYPAGQPQHARLRDELPDFWMQASLLLMGTILGAGAVRWWWAMARRRPRFRRRPAVRRQAVTAPVTSVLRLDSREDAGGETAPPSDSLRTTDEPERL